MLSGILYYTLVPIAVVSAVFFLPKWLYWITPYAYSPYDVLVKQYSRKVALGVYIGMIVVLDAFFFLLEATKHW